jgi:hypothetical protein
LSRLPKRLGAALVIVALGRLLSPAAVPVFDGIGQPDEPYRYVAPPPGATKTAAATTAKATSPIVDGKATYGLSVATAEVGPQLSLYLPPKSLAATGRTLTVTAAPVAPTDQPEGATIDGNVYEITVSEPVTLTPQAALATLYLRATTAKQPGPVMEYRAKATDPWQELRTSRGGTDVYVSTFPGPGFYALAFDTTGKLVESGRNPSRAPYVVLGGVGLLVVVVVTVRLRAAK